jgi:hypothetical protein
MHAPAGLGRVGWSLATCWLCETAGWLAILAAARGRRDGISEILGVDWSTARRLVTALGWRLRPAVGRRAHRRDRREWRFRLRVRGSPGRANRTSAQPMDPQDHARRPRSSGESLTWAEQNNKQRRHRGPHSRVSAASGPFRSWWQVMCPVSRHRGQVSQDIQDTYGAPPTVVTPLAGRSAGIARLVW